MRERTRSDDIQDDDSYYFEDAIFLVEKTRFKIPRHLFEQESPTFRKMFSSSLDQSTLDDPLFLTGVSKTDFVAFLKLICPKNFFQREELSSKDWESVLKLSTMWGFDEARAQAIEKLAPTTAAADPIQIILLAKEHNVPQWYSSSLKQLVEREDPLTVEEVNRLGLELGLKVAQMRGKVEGFKIAESRFNQAVHSMTTAFTYVDFWDTIVTDADDWLPRTVPQPLTPHPPGVIRFPSPMPSTLSEERSCPPSPRPTWGLPSKPSERSKPQSPWSNRRSPHSQDPRSIPGSPMSPPRSIASPESKPASEYDFVSTPRTAKSPTTLLFEEDIPGLATRAKSSTPPPCWLDFSSKEPEPEEPAVHCTPLDVHVVPIQKKSNKKKGKK